MKTKVRQEQLKRIIARVREEIWRMRENADIERVLIAVREVLQELGIPFNNCGVNLVDRMTDPPSIWAHNMTQGGQWIQVESSPGAEVVIKIWQGQAVAYQRDLDVEDMYGEADRIRQLFGHHVRSVIDVPFSHGTLAVNSTQPGAFSQRDIELLQEMAQMLSEGFIRLEDFRLLSVFNQIGQVVLSSLEVEQVASALAEHIVQSGIFRSLMVALVDEQTQSVEVIESMVRRSDGLIARTSNKIKIRYDLNDPNITAEVASTGEMRVIVEWDDRFDRRVDPPGSRRGQVAYFIPVKREGRVLAVLATGSRVDQQKEMLHLIERMAPLLNEVAIALEHARLYREVRESEEALQESNRRLEETLAELKATQQHIVQHERLRALGQMASGIAHDFNNALSPIMGYSELLLMFPNVLDDKERVIHDLQLINTAAKDAANVVRRLREFYRHREESEVFQPVNLNHLIEQAISFTQPKWREQALENNVTIFMETDFQPVPRIAGNDTELREVLINLIFNAVDAISQKAENREQKAEEETISLRTYPSGEYVVLEVSDTGVGMTEEVRRRCLEPFFTTKGDRGTGMGLAVVFGIIQRHDGKIDMKSEEGKGTTVIIRLPSQTVHETEGRMSEATSSLRSLRVLVVDDEPSMREIIASCLTEDGHTAETATNGREGLEKFHAGRFDVIVTDGAMPEMSGHQLAAAIKRIAPNKPVILLSGFGDVPNVSGKNIDVIVGKPFTLAELRGALAAVV